MNKEEALKKFEEVYKYQISPKIPALEKERKILLFFTISIVVSFLLLFVSAWTMATGRSTNNGNIYIIWFVFIVIHAILISKFRKNFINKSKEALLQPILSIFNFKRNSKDKNNFAIEELKNLGFFRNSKYKTEDDKITYNTNNTTVVMSDIELYHHIRFNRQKHTVVDFRGLIIKIYLEKTFSGVFIKEELTDLRKLPKYAQNILAINTAIQRYDNSSINYESGVNIFSCKDSLENTLFHTNNKKQANEFVETSLYKKLQNLNKILTTEKITYALKENNLYILITSNGTSKDEHYKYSSDFFELGSLGTNTSFYDINIYKNLFSQIYKIAKAIDYILLESEQSN